MALAYVRAKNGSPLMPTSSARARKLLKAGKAKCVLTVPFTIQLLRDTTKNTQSLTHKIDPGATKAGSAVEDDKGNIVYVSEIELRNDIPKKMKRRKGYRRSRRNRNTRYRPVRFDNRKNSRREGRLPPTLVSKIAAHEKEIKVVGKLLPITKLVVEVASFDPHALENPAVLEDKSLYQKGPNYKFANRKAAVLHRDEYKCQQCKKAKKGAVLHVHHIAYRSEGGSDSMDNLITLCKPCHDGVHDGSVVLKKRGKAKGVAMRATQMNVIVSRLIDKYDPEVTYGYITKENRQALGLPKTHYFDAAAMGHPGAQITFKTNKVLLKRCIPKGDYRQSMGVRSERPIPTGKIQGFRKFDKVWYKGRVYFIMGRYSTGYAVLMNIDGEKAMRKIPRLDSLQRISARKSWIIKEETIPNIF